jgi:hypothetical protein
MTREGIGIQEGFAKRTTTPVKQRKSGQVYREIDDFDLPLIDPDFLITERDPKNLHRFTRGLLNQLRKPSRSYSIEMVKAATVWLVGAYVDAKVPLAPEMYPLIAGVVKWQRPASTFRKVQRINEEAYWAAVRFEASKPADPKGKAPSAASLYSVAKHVLELKGVGFQLQGTRKPRNLDVEPGPEAAQKSAEATIRGWRKIEHYRQNVRLQQNFKGNFNKIRTAISRGGVKT